MSTLWTPYGERPVPDPTHRPGGPAPTAGPAHEHHEHDAPPAGPATDRPGTRDTDEMRRALDALLSVPASQVVAELAMQLRELALVHLAGGRPGSTEAARLAIDAMAALTEGLGERLAPHERALAAALAEVRLAFVQATAGTGQAAASGPGAPIGNPGAA